MSTRQTELGLLLAAAMRPIMRDCPFIVQAGALAELVSIMAVQCHPDDREKFMTAFNTSVRNLIPINEKIMFPDGLPKEWEKANDGAA